MGIERILQTGLALAIATALTSTANALPMDPDNTHDNCQELAFEAQMLDDACDDAYRELSAIRREMFLEDCEFSEGESDPYCYTLYRRLLSADDAYTYICGEAQNTWADFQTCLDEQNPYWL